MSKRRNRRRSRVRDMTRGSPTKPPAGIEPTAGTT
jgi:hypothetical protein